MNSVNAIKAALARYPAVTAAVLQIAVAMAARYGLHVTVTQLVYVLSFLAAVIAPFLHTGYAVKAKRGNLS